MRKTRFAHETVGHQPSRDPHFLFLFFQFRRGSRTKCLRNLSGGMTPAKFPRERLMPQGLNLLEFFLPLLKLVARLELQGSNPFEKGKHASIAARAASEQPAAPR